jgi:hypothetical protein
VRRLENHSSKIGDRKSDCCCPAIFSYIIRVKSLTRQEQLVLCVVLGLLLTGLAVKTYRAAHPPAPPATQQAKP